MISSGIVVMGDGHAIPQIGFGTYKIPDADAAPLVATAIEVGYRHVDTAQMYGNEVGVGRGIADSGVARDELFVTSKLDNPNHAPGTARASIERSLEDLGLDRLDLFLIHWPYPADSTTPLAETWQVLVDARAAGLVTSIGMSNGQPEHLREIQDAGLPLPALDQAEIHPYLQNQEVVDFCRAEGITVQAWSPIARGRVLTDPVVEAVAAEVGASPAQVVLAWHVGRDHVIIPKASSRKRIEENLGALQVELTAEQAARIDALDQGEAGRTGMHPSTMKRYGEE
ncbi:aldo/keto reductase [Georgenia sp. Z1344]|uniref:aldo/keto reductase n=1 Tax=Georgenia sp. Z1344 TaxID=3416706 RepID=UPI003CEE8C09